MKWSIVRLLLAAAAALLPVLAAADGAVPVETFFRRAAVLEYSLSPSGRRLAVSTELQGRVGLFVIDLQTAEFTPTRAALFNDADVDEFRWVDDERLVFDLVDLQAGSAEDYRTLPGLFAVRYDGEELRMLIERRGRPWVVSGERRQPSLERNHQLLHVPEPPQPGSPAPRHDVIVGEWSYAGQDLRDLRPKWLNTRTGRTEDIPMEGRPANVVWWWFGPGGQPRAAVSRLDGRDALHWYHLPADGKPGRWERLAEGPMQQLPIWPIWVGAGDRLYVTRNEGPARERVVAPYDFAARAAGAPLVVAPGFDFTGQLLGSPDGSRLLGVRVDTDAEQTVWLDPARKALQARVDEALPGRVNRMACRRCEGPDPVVLVRSWSDRDPGQLLLWQPGTDGGKGRWQVVAQQQPGIDPQRMGRLSLERIRARDGRDLPVWITRPADFQPGQPRPAVVLVHGGPWVRGGHWRWDRWPQFLASRGYVVIEPEFRGSSGYGRAHRQAGFRQWGQAMQDDVADALRWAQAQKIASDKACIAGGSYGGYSTLMGLVRDPGLYRCGSAWFAVADLLLYVDGGWFVDDDISDLSRRYTLRELVGDPDRDRAMLLAHSPVEQAARLKAPLQLISGSNDRRVPLNHATRLRSAMQASGLEPEWVVYNGEAHGLRLLENQIDMARKVEAFFARHLK